MTKAIDFGQNNLIEMKIDKKSSQNIWWVIKKLVPLHPLNKSTPCLPQKKRVV